MTTSLDPAASPRVVAIGGGHGLAASLAGFAQLGVAPTAIVSVADDGGSTGRLREELHVPAVGDLRKALVALAPAGSLFHDAMSHRFTAGALAGHAFGNLAIAAMVEVTGDLVAALDELARLCGSVGRVLPTALTPVTLVARTATGEIRGQATISTTSGIQQVWLEPGDAETPKEALDAIAEADLVVIGPGSLYTSVLAAAAAPSIRDALRSTDATVVYACNLRPQEGETAGYGVADHVDALAAHGIRADRVLYDPDTIGSAEGVEGAVAAALARPNGLAHHPRRLAEAVLDLVA